MIVRGGIHWHYMMGRSRRSRRRSKVALALLLAASAAVVLLGLCMPACSGPGNTGQSTIDASLIEAVPWTNGGVPILEGGQPIIPAAPVYPPIATGERDPGSGPVDCTALSGIETSPGFYDTFEPPADDGGELVG